MDRENYIIITPEIYKKLIKEGECGRRPSLKWTCYADVVFQTSVEDENFQSGPKEIKIGDGITPCDRIIETCLETMHLKEQSVFHVKLLPKNVELDIMITLNSFEEMPYIFQWTKDEKLKEINYFRNMGIELFRKNQIEEAFYKFSRALKLLIMSDSVLETDNPGDEIDSLRIALYNNLAQCHLHKKNFVFVIELCSKSIEINCSSKALYRRAIAHIELKEYEKAENDLISLLKLEPKNKAAIEKYKLVRELDRTNRETYHSMLKRMFS